MREIQITVRDKIARKICDTVYVCDNSDYGVVFDFDEDWQGETVKTARFSYGGTHKDVVFEGNVCAVPMISNTHNIKVGVFAGNQQTTTAAYVPAKKSILCEDGVPADPTPDVYAQIMKLLNESDGESIPWLKGDTSTITPTQVAAALLADQDVMIAHQTPEFGTVLFTSFIIMEGYKIASSGVAEIDGTLGAGMLIGDMESDTWVFTAETLAKQSDIPTKTSELTNDSNYIISPSFGFPGCFLALKSVDENGKPTEWETAFMQIPRPDENVVKTINGEMPDENGNIIINTLDDTEIADLAAALI